MILQDISKILGQIQESFPHNIRK